MNTNKQDQKNQRQKATQQQRPKKQGDNPKMLHVNHKSQEHEHPEARLTR